ncbi:MAG TPA: ribose 5-phosphate isomerase B [Fimbriimonas sp.]|nr:ribose 5-phosphate isomerase B [Fimbriimonas sp.]
MKIAVGADHAGFELKEALKQQIIDAGHDLTDLGAETYEPLDDYPDFAAKVGRAVASKEVDRAILICGSGIGASIAANKIKGVRAGIATESYAAHQGVEHDDMNVLVLASRIIGIEVAHEAVRSFLNAEFSGEERHVRRLNKVLLLEEAGE